METATIEIYTLSLHDALPIFPGKFPWMRARRRSRGVPLPSGGIRRPAGGRPRAGPDRKSTRLNSSHSQKSYAVFCMIKNNIRLLELVNKCTVERGARSAQKPR